MRVNEASSSSDYGALGYRGMSVLLPAQTWDSIAYPPGTLSGVLKYFSSALSVLRSHITQTLGKNISGENLQSVESRTWSGEMPRMRG